MKYSFKNKLISTLMRSKSYKTIYELDEYITMLKAIDKEATIKLNRIKSIFLNCDYLNDILYIEVTPMSKENTISHNILERTRDITLKYPKDDNVIEQLFIIEKLIDGIDIICNYYNKYITVAIEFKKFLAENNLDPINLKRPHFQLFKDKFCNPVLFFTPYNENYNLTSHIFNGTSRFSINYDSTNKSFIEKVTIKNISDFEENYLDMCNTYFKSLLNSSITI